MRRPEHVQVAAALRRMREHAKVTRDEAASILGCTRSKIGDLETGRSKPKPAELERLLDHYGIVGSERDEVIEFARTSHTRRKPSPYTMVVIPATVRRAVDLEAQATSTFFYSGELIPGILQVPAYAKAILELVWPTQPDDVARRLELRAERARTLTRTHRPPLRCWCILGEAALRTNVGGPSVMRDQLKHLIDASHALDNLTIQILPLGSGPHPFLGVTVTILRFPSPAPDRMLVEAHEREIVRDDLTEITHATRHLDLLRDLALDPASSVSMLRQVHRELS